MVDVTEQTHQQGRVENMKDFMVFITFTSNFDTFWDTYDLTNILKLFFTGNQMLKYSAAICQILKFKAW